MNDNKEQNEQHEELRDLDVREKQAEGVKGGVSVEVCRTPGPVGPVPTPYPNQNTRG